MPTCENCHSKWGWKQTVKKTFTLNPGMTCPYCGEKQYQTQKSKKVNAYLTPIVLIPLLLNIFFDIPRPILFGLFLILFVTTLLIFPFLIKLSSKEEYIDLS